MTQDLTPEHSKAKQKKNVTPEMNNLLLGIFGCMSGEPNIAQLAVVLGVRKKLSLEPLEADSLLPGAKLSFKNSEGNEDLGLTIKHNDQSRRLIVDVRTPSGLWDRSEIAQLLRRILDNATDRQIDFKELEKNIASDASPTNNQPIYFHGAFDIPVGLESKLLDKAQEVINRDADAQIVVVKIFEDILRRFSKSAENPSPKTGEDGPG